MNKKQFPCWMMSLLLNTFAFSASFLLCFLVIAFYLYRFFFALELSKILKYKPEQLHHPNVLQNLFRFSVFSIQIALNYSWWLFHSRGTQCMMDTNFEEESQNVKRCLVHSLLSLHVSLSFGRVKCSNSNSRQQRFQCHL